MKRTRLVFFGAVLGPAIACGGATFTSAPGDGGSDDGSGGAGSSGAGSSSGSGSSSGAGSSGGGSSSGNASSGGGSGSGGSGGSSGGSGSGGSSGARCDAGCFDAGASPCPTVAPTANTACAHSGLVCEYGSAVVQACDTVATCGSSGWTIQSPTMSCSTALPPGCPATYSSVPQGATCAQNGLVCDYLLGRCSCNPGGGIIRVVDGAVVASWYCQAPATGCPQRRPPLGSACSTAANLSCDYGACYVPDGTTETCTGGVWVLSFTACPA